MAGVTLWLTGDMMTGRGIDQGLLHPANLPVLAAAGWIPALSEPPQGGRVAVPEA
ncbi:MAG: hypothetical protein ACQER5_12480 [Pseudomonadota bacterium]